MNLMQGLKAIASDRRMKILRVLAGPAASKSPKRELSASQLCRATGLSQPALSEQMLILLNTGLVEARREGRYVFYSRDEERIKQFRQTIMSELLPPAG